MRELLNLFLKKFDLKLISSGRYVCKNCNRGYGGLAPIIGEDYVYEKYIDVDRTSQSGEYSPYGWVVEWSWCYNGTWSSYEQQWNRKVYMSERSALEALVQFQNYSDVDPDKRKYRLVPIYNLPKIETRKIKISKIINKN